MDKSNLELKVGVFVFGAIIILGIFILKIGGFKNYAGYPIKFMFNNVSGVKPGSPVRFAGVDVGEVRDVNILSNQQDNSTQIEVVGWIRGSLSIPQDSQVYVNTLGLLGEKYIEIIPPAEVKSFIKSGDTLVGVDPIMLHHWIDEGTKIVKDFQELLLQLKSGEGTVGKLLSDDKLYQELEALISDLRRHPWKLFWKTREKK